MITALKKYDGINFECHDFIIMHSSAGFEIKPRGGVFRSITESSALEFINDCLAVQEEANQAA